MDGNGGAGGGIDALQSEAALVEEGEGRRNIAEGSSKASAVYGDPVWSLDFNENILKS